MFCEIQPFQAITQGWLHFPGNRRFEAGHRRYALGGGVSSQRKPWNEQAQKRKHVREALRACFRDRCFMGLTSPAVTAAQLKLHTDQRLIEKPLTGAFVGNAQLNNYFDAHSTSFPTTLLKAAR